MFILYLNNSNLVKKKQLLKIVLDTKTVLRTQLKVANNWYFYIFIKKQKMMKTQFKIRKWIYSFSIFVALVIMTDFFLPGKVFIEDLERVKKERQRYYNAAQNHHYSFRVFTKKHNFSVSEEFAKEIQNSKKVKYTVSKIFNEVTSYSSLISDKKGIFSLRIFSGLVIPLLVVVTLGLAFQYEKKINILIFVIHVLLIANLVFLMN